MNRTLSAIFAMLLCAFSVGSNAQVNDTKLMSDSDYRTLLFQVEKALPKWEVALKNIDPEKDEKISYSLGKAIVEQRDLGLMEIGNIRANIAKERVKHTVYGELTLFQFLQSLFDQMSAETSLEVAGGLTLSSLEKFAPELGSLEKRIGNDAMQRVALLEKGACP